MLRSQTLPLVLALLVPALGCFSDPISSDTGSSAGDTGEVCEGELDECGVCEGPGGPCVGCTVPEASNYDELAELDNGTCICTPNGNPIADQAQLDGGSGGGGMSSWQSFTPEIGGGLARVSLEVGSPVIGAPGQLVVSIHEGEGPAGTTLGTTELAVPDAIPSLQAFEFDEPIPLGAERVYTIVITAPTQTQGYLAYSTEDPYPRGRMETPEDDMVFRTEMVACVPD